VRRTASREVGGREVGSRGEAARDRAASIAGRVRRRARVDDASL